VVLTNFILVIIIFSITTIVGCSNIKNLS